MSTSARVVNKFTSAPRKDEILIIGDEYCEDDPSGLSSHEVKMTIRNHTASLLWDWTWYSGVAFFIADMLATGIFFLAQASAFYWFAGSSAVNVAIRAFIVGLTTFFVKFFFGRHTTAHLDPIRTMAGCITFIVTRGRKMGDGKLWIELLKIPFFIVAQFLGVLVFLALLGVSTDTDIKTSDCALIVPTPAVCAVYPIKGVGVSTTALAWQEALGAIVIYGSLVLGERFFSWKWPGSIGSAISYGTGTMIVHLIWGNSSGGSFNFWYWAMTGWFSNIDDDDRGYRVWPLMLGVFIVTLLDIVGYYLWQWHRSTNTQPKVSYE